MTDTELVEAVYMTANNTIYFGDSSDYRQALIDICLLIKPDIDTIGESYIEPA